MHRSEERENLSCSSCGARVDTQPGGSYAFGTECVLCFECATERGGSYNADRDTWVEPPRVSDLAREES